MAQEGLPYVYLVFSNQSVTSSGTLTSSTFPVRGADRVAVQYKYANATSDLVFTTANFLVAADENGTFEIMRDSANNLQARQIIMNTAGAFVMLPSGSFPPTPFGKLQIKSVTNSTITFDSVYVIISHHG